MAHFSLGNALLQADRKHEAALSFIACTKINPGMTKAYQLAARALIDSGHSDDAMDVLHDGYIEATKRGDMLPKNAMAEMFGELRLEVPVVETPQASAPEEVGGDFTPSPDTNPACDRLQDSTQISTELVTKFAYSVVFL